MSGNASFLSIESLNLGLGRFALREVALSCAQGEYHILLGPTGSGKTSLLKSLLGFHRPESGSISLDGRDITYELPERRRMGYVPQDYALFPHLNVEENLRFGMRARGLPAAEADALVNRWCEVLGIGQLRQRGIQHLSGGERQKVAIGRALGTQPKMLLLDEPFSSIDEGAKRGLWLELRQIIREVGITTLHVTHNLDEAYSLGERLSVMIDGRLVQSGARQEIFEHPSSERVARYLSYTNVFEGETHSHTEGTRVALGHFDVVVGPELAADKRVRVCIRQQDIRIIKEGSPIRESLQRNVLSGEIVSLFPLREEYVMWFKINGSPKSYDLELRFPIYMQGRHKLEEGKRIKVALWEPMIMLFED
jgi:ABC-type Fe3+/spermidine/putrescine transport system ATPase subunit